jgi:hypothetical protein
VEFTLNLYSESERLQTMLSCCYAAARTGFPHLAIRHVINPPHEWFDAALARQIAIYILHVEFDVPRRRIVAMQERRRASISAAIRTIDARLEDAVFARAYARYAARAKGLFISEVQKVAA